MHGRSARYLFPPRRMGRATERDDKAGAWLRSPTFRAHGTVHGFDHGARDVQADADTALVVHAAVDLLALGQRLEDARHVRRQTDALVLDNDLDSPGRAPRTDN